MKLGLVPIDRGEEEDTVAADGRREEEGVEAAVDTNRWHLPSAREVIPVEAGKRSQSPILF